MIRALIIDLDNCVAAADEVGKPLFEPVFQSVRETNRNHLSELDLEKAFTDMWYHSLDWVAARHRFTKAMLEAAFQACSTIEVSHPLQGYGDLMALARLSAERFLVTSGFRRLQESKIAALKLAPLFTETHVDAIDEPNRIGKRGHFERIMQDHLLHVSEVLVVGDNAESEIAVGNQLGIRTVQTLRPGVIPTDNATFHIKSFHELNDVVQLCSTPKEE